MAEECRKYKIRGLVQGVYYRANTQEIGESLGLTGWVRNTEDGGVECVACGDAEKLDAFEKWLRKGPTRARVDEVSSKQIDSEDHQSFVIRY